MNNRGTFSKKIILITAFFFISTQLFAINSSVSLGYQDVECKYHEFDPIYTSIDLWQNFDSLQIYGNYKNEMSKNKSGWQFSPSQDYFTVGITYDFSAFRVTAEHMCQHSVVSQGVNKGIGGGYSKIEITIGDKRQF